MTAHEKQITEEKSVGSRSFNRRKKVGINLHDLFLLILPLDFSDSVNIYYNAFKISSDLKIVTSSNF